MNLKSGQTQKEIFSVCADTKWHTQRKPPVRTEFFFLLSFVFMHLAYAGCIAAATAIRFTSYISYSRVRSRWRATACALVNHYEWNRLRDVVKTFDNIYAFDFTELVCEPFIGSVFAWMDFCCLNFAVRIDNSSHFVVLTMCEPTRK